MRDIYLYKDCDILKIYFDDIGDISKPEYLVKIVEDAINRVNKQKN